MTNISKISFSFCLMTLTAACNSTTGGENTNPVQTNPPTVTTPAVKTPSFPSYETLSSTANSTSTLGGVAVQTNNTTGGTTIVNSTGSVKHDAGATTIDDGTYTLTDANGFDANRVLTDGVSTLVAHSSGAYDYVATYTQTYSTGGTTFDVAGLAGIVTRSGDMPTQGGASYTGDANGVLVTATQGFNLENGTSTVIANFNNAGSVDVMMTGFTARDQATGNTAIAPIDTISVTGMAISGNGFSGGTLATTNRGAAVDVTGANTTQQIAGNFFGFDSGQFVPDEVGGVVGARGDDGILGTIFIAD